MKRTVMFEKAGLLSRKRATATPAIEQQLMDKLAFLKIPTYPFPVFFDSQKSSRCYGHRSGGIPLFCQ